MDKTRIITTICYAVSALALLGLIIWLFLMGLFSGVGFGLNFVSGGTFSEVGSHSVSIDNIESLDVQWISGRVYVGSHNGDEIIIREFARRDLSAGEELTMNTDNNILTIGFTESRGLFNDNLVKQLEVLIPIALIESFDVFKVNTVSGRIDARDIGANDFAVHTTSGRIELDNIMSPYIDAFTVSGRVVLRKIESERVNVQTVSGRIEASNTIANDVHLQTTSGRIEVRNSQVDALSANAMSGRLYLSGSFHDVYARSTSGRIEVISQIIPDSLLAHASSGRIVVRVPSSDPISVEHSTTTGRFNSEIPIISHGGADAQFRLSTSSGRINIYELR